ncbi:MAG TPA: S8 family serine peptidase [Terriglobales bacterium]|jgi:subtilase family protein/peptidase inhibitor I9|nr:S8 family serine peptidase [Terriglobales bacterium]
MKSINIASTLILAGIIASASVAYAQQAGGGKADTAVPLTPAMAAQLSQNVSRPVIVIMKNQLTGAGAASDQAPVMSELRQVNAARIKSYRLVNSFAATVSDGEVERLKANPAVALVIPDVVIHRAPRSQTAASTAVSALTPSTSLTPNIIPGACGANGEALVPEALEVTNTDSNDPFAQTARSLGITGAGVKVAWIADGVDPNNVNFIRKDGTSAFIDFQDFSGDGPNAPTDGTEAFLDSNSIAGQGIQVYNVNGYSEQTYPFACNILIEGVAPGASLVGLKAFSEFYYTTESNILEAIDYAVFTDHVDVLNESFGSNDFPDIGAQDITKLFDEAAVAAGVTVTVSSGDSGSTNTIGTPATDPLVISAGASTTFRIYAQTNYGEARYFATTGWLNDNISSLSSGGFSEAGGTIDLVAPGDFSAWISCDASSNFLGCTNLLGIPSVIDLSGGTSESSPLTAGAAALVIEAYRNTHHGASPSPALVKQILTSTATDLGVPATEQGAGILNSYKAVVLAESINTSHGPWGAQTLLLSENQLNAVGAPGTFNSWPVTVTNTSPFPQLVEASGRTFGPNQNVQSGTVTLSDTTSSELLNYNDLPYNYAVFTFNVPGGANRLDASIAFPEAPTHSKAAALSLIDPQGRFAANTVPQGAGNFGNVDVREPAPGTWTGIIYARLGSLGGTTGTIPWQVSTQRFVPFGSVFPSWFFLFPGQSQTLNVTASTPSTPGDAAGSIVLTSSGGGFDKYVGAESNSIPVTLRSLVDLAHGGAFSGVLTGGNGRAPGEGQVDYYEFNVGPGHSSITANVSLTNDVGDVVGTYLVNPDGVAVGFGQNSLNGTNSLSLTAYTLNPVAGTWTLIVDFAEPVVGDEISQPFTGNIKLDNVSASAAGLPTSRSTKLAAGVPVTVPVTITNNGAAPEAFFIDARLNATTSVPLVSQFGLPSGYEYPLPLYPYYPLWLVPTQTSSVQAAASANVPIEFDYSPYTGGDPDLFGPPTTPNNAAGSYTPTGGTVEQGLWQSLPSEIGPYPAGGAPPGLVTESLTATTKAFDPTVTSPTGDLWLYSLNAFYSGFAPVTINPGQTVVIDVTITPSGASGTVVSGNLYVDDLVSALPPYDQFTGDELAAIPYTYTIK